MGCLPVSVILVIGFKYTKSIVLFTILNWCDTFIFSVVVYGFISLPEWGSDSYKRLNND